MIKVKSKKNIEEKKFVKGEVVEIILRVLAVMTIVGGSIVMPNLPIILGLIISLIKEKDHINIPPVKIKNALKVLERRKIIDLIEDKDNVYVKFRKDNETEILKYSIKQLLTFKKQSKQWNNKWVLVVFDVPEVQSNKRRFLRRYLNYLGFYPYQKSVYVFPYACLEEIDLIKKITASGKYLKYIIAEKLEEEDKIKIFFKLM